MRDNPLVTALLGATRADNQYCMESDGEEALRSHFAFDPTTRASSYPIDAVVGTWHFSASSHPSTDNSEARLVHYPTDAATYYVWYRLTGSKS